MENLSEIKNHFNDQDRVQHDINSYHLSVMPPKGNFDPYEKPREDFIFSLILQQLQSGSILDIGCGIGNLVRRLKSEGTHCQGLDISEQMVHTAQQLLQQAGFNPNDIQCGDIFEYQMVEKYQLAIANGVIWYYQDKLKFLTQVNHLLQEKGITIIVHRNDMFNIFAMNEGTLHFMLERLFAGRTLEDRNRLQTELLQAYPNLAAPISVNSNLKKEYDNPLTIADLYHQAGFEVLAINYTYIHPFPPRFIAKEETATIDYSALQQEYGAQWQGMFLGSQFIVTAQKC